MSLLPTHAHFKKIGMHPHHGIALPLSAVLSEKSVGIGEFLDLIPLIEWCHEVGMDVIQLLPLNDTGEDPSPYNALSSCALHPIYLSLHALPHVKDLPDALHLNTLPRVDYARVLETKLHFLRAYEATHGEALRSQPAFSEFVQNNPWLLPYALFKALSERLGNRPWTSWPKKFQTYHPDLEEKYHSQMQFHLTLQYLSFLQLTRVKKYAEEKGVFLQGDIPILVSPTGVDVWQSPQFFDLTHAAGVPPDMFNPEGQYWGFPLFKWDALKQESYSWWTTRLKTASDYYHLYRLDHVVGFFRIWAIPLGQPAKKGEFLPTHPALWIPQGKEILLKLLETTPMLPIAEDLGTVPLSVTLCLQELGICGTKVIRWEYRDELEINYIPYAEYPPLSMTTVSTADSSPLQLWWQEGSDEVKAFASFKGWAYSPFLSLERHFEILRDSHQTPSLFHINPLQEYLALFPYFVGPNPEDERINIPGTILPTNWTYRFRPSVEAILASSELKETVKRMFSN